MILAGTSRYLIVMVQVIGATVASSMAGGCGDRQPAIPPAMPATSSMRSEDPQAKKSAGPFRVILAAYPRIARVGEPIIITEVLVNASDEPVVADFRSASRLIVPPVGGWPSEKELKDGMSVPLEFAFTGLYSEGRGGTRVTRYEPWEAESRVYTLTPTHVGDFDLEVRWTSDHGGDAPPSMWRGTVHAKPLRLRIVKGNSAIPATTLPAGNGSRTGT
jgi:hypothetical protein